MIYRNVSAKRITPSGDNETAVRGFDNTKRVFLSSTAQRSLPLNGSCTIQFYYPKIVSAVISGNITII